VMRSFRSLSFFNPPKAIFVPGMNFFGFSRYSNCSLPVRYFCYSFYRIVSGYQTTLVPLDALRLVGISVCEALDLSSVTSEKAEEVGADLVSLTLTESVALCATGLEKVGTLLCVS
jgi:hypothetical protein